ncbi:O-antigen translocase [Pontimicrobium aquaticum]|uniref:O-antigen translocase n=1 Tax=Pontimicrobium aquaticum TaxID=2565367 RepID=A0A4U0EYC3_9FLAO|nr:O-antigen translocase [Pontimicrobium aquaticum]TJY36404.1 O-antigen translocase [Pontimicrobium aquaticum]
MKKLIKYINSKVLVKVAWLHSATVLTKIVSGFLTTKFVAIFIGAEGLALIGNLRSFFTSIQTFATLGLYNGVVKFIGKFKEDASKLSKTISTAYYAGFFATILVSLLCYYNAEALNAFLFSNRYNFTYIIKIMALAVPFYSLNMFCFSIMNGFSKYRILLVINIIGQLMGLAVTLLLIWKDNIDGALISVVISPSLIFLITLVGILNRRSLISQIRVENIDFKWIKKFAPFVLMAIVSGIILPLVMIAIRNYIITSQGMNSAGYWEAMNRISTYYLMFVNSLMTLYFLPRFTEIKDKKEFKAEVLGFYKNIAPVFGLGLLVIYLLKPFIVLLFLTDDFTPVEQLFGWQLLGDFIKILSVLIAYNFIAKKMFWHFVITELFLVFMTYFTSIYLVDMFGVVGANMAHFISYVMYFIIILLIFSSSIFGVIPEPDE